MRAIVKFLAGAAAMAAFVGAAPAAAQDYPGYNYPGYGNPYGGPNSAYGAIAGNSQVAVNQCAAAVQSRLGGGGYNGYGYGGGRVLGISRIEPRDNGGLTVRGVASSGQYATYGYGYNGQPPVDLVWKCKIDYRGVINDINIDRAQSNYGYNGSYTPYNYDYSQYGYHRY